METQLCRLSVALLKRKCFWHFSLVSYTKARFPFTVLTHFYPKRDVTTISNLQYSMIDIFVFFHNIYVWQMTQGYIIVNDWFQIGSHFGLMAPGNTPLPEHVLTKLNMTPHSFTRPLCFAGFFNVNDKGIHTPGGVDPLCRAILMCVCCWIISVLLFVFLCNKNVSLNNVSLNELNRFLQASNKRENPLQRYNII